MVKFLAVRRPLLTLCALAALTFALGLGRQAITDADEAYYAEAAHEMVTSGDWLTPRFNFADRWQKPVLYYWLTAATYAVAGTTEWAARLWAALSGIGLAAVTWAVARRWPSGGRGDGTDDKAAWLAGAIVATTFGYSAMARAALPDLPLAFFITATVAATLRAAEGDGRHWWLAAGALAGCGFLMKGPVALAVPAVVVLPIWWLERRHVRVSVSGLAIAVAAWAVVGLPWYVAMTATHGTPYLESFFVADNLERFTTTRFNEPRPLWFYPLVVAGGMMPWSIFAIGPAGAALRDAVGLRLAVSAGERRLLVWAGLPLLLFMASVGQQPRYVLPVLPPLAILLASAIARRVRKGNGLAFPTWGSVALLLALAGALLRLRPMLITVHVAAPWVVAGTFVVAAMLLAGIGTTRRWTALPVGMTAAAAILVLGVQFGALAGRRPEAVEAMATAVHSHRQAAERVGAYRSFVRNLVFYTHLKQEDLFDEAAAAMFLQSSDRVLLVAPLAELGALERAAGVTTRELARVTYLNTANLRLGALVHPTPESQLETVVLVANR